MSTNINPQIWGSSAWQFMHYVTLSYPDNPTNVDKINMYNFFTSMQKILPCDKCRYNFLEHQKKYPLDDKTFSSRYNLVNWLLNIHNNVNIETGKPTMTYDEFISMYMPELGMPTNSLSNLINFDMHNMIVIFIVILILILLLCLRIKNK